jgi:DNA mismatch repair ATPase MutS
MRDLIIKEILPNKGLKNDLYRITKREILAYMRSDQCKNELKNLIINEILRNYKITNDLFELIKEFVTKKETKMLENKLEKILTDVLCIEAIHKHVSNKMESEINRALRDEGIIKMAINMVTGDNDNNK